MNAEKVEQPPVRLESPQFSNIETSAQTRSDLPSSTERSAERAINSLNLDDKLKLTPDQSDSLRKLESGILKGDLPSVEKSLQQYKGNPEAAKPVMDVLIKDLKAAGISASYDVDLPLTKDGGAEKSGILSLSTSKGGMDLYQGDNKEMTLYTNPKSTTFADHQIPRHPANGGYISPEHKSIPADAALAVIGSTATSNLLEKQN